MSEEKTHWATQFIIFLGMGLDSANRLILIPLEKRDCAITSLQHLIKKRTVSVLKLQQISGFLNHLCKAIFLARAFTRKLYMKTAGKKQHHHVNLDAETKDDCKVWLDFLQEENVSSVCRLFVDLSLSLKADEIMFYSDASTGESNGIGCVFNTRWCFDYWELGFIKKNQPSIEYLELYTITVAVVLWAKYLPNRRVVIFCDNQMITHVLNKSMSSCRNCLMLLRIIIRTSLRHNVRFFCKQMIGSRNIIADSLSRKKFDTFWNRSKQLNLNMEPEPDKLPEDIWSPSKIWKSHSGIPGLEEVWIIGDCFLTDANKYLLQIRKEFDNNSWNRNFFIYQNYTVKIYLATSYVNPNYICRFRNALAEGLNTRHIIPKMLFVIMNNGLNNKPELANDLIAWLAKEIYRCLQMKLDQLLKRCIPKFNTKVIFVKPVTRWGKAVDYYTHTNINDAIELAIKVDQDNFREISINSILPREDRLFHNMGELSGKGFQKYWLYLDDQVHLASRTNSSTFRNPAHPPFSDTTSIATTNASTYGNNIMYINCLPK